MFGRAFTNGVLAIFVIACFFAFDVLGGRSSIPNAHAQIGANSDATFVRETHGSWNVVCENANPANCYMSQVAVDVLGNDVAELSLQPIVGAEQQGLAAGMTVLTGLQTALQLGVGIQVDQGEGVRVPYEYCTELACVARLLLTETGLNSYKAGLEAKVFVTSIRQPRTPVVATISLNGFTAAFNSISGAQ